MEHKWTVKQDGKTLGTVTAVSRKGACHEAFEKFNVPPNLRNTMSVERQEMVIGGIDMASPDVDGQVVCSFNPELARQDSGRTLEDCRMRFEQPPFTGSPKVVK